MDCLRIAQFSQALHVVIIISLSLGDCDAILSKLYCIKLQFTIGMKNVSLSPCIVRVTTQPTDLQWVFDSSDPVELLSSLEFIWTPISQTGI